MFVINEGLFVILKQIISKQIIWDRKALTWFLIHSSKFGRFENSYKLYFCKNTGTLSSGLISGIRRMFRLFYIKPKLSCSSTSVLIKTTNFRSKYFSNVRQIFLKVYIFNNRTEKVGFIILHVNRRTTRLVLHCQNMYK